MSSKLRNEKLISIPRLFAWSCSVHSLILTFSIWLSWMLNVFHNGNLSRRWRANPKPSPMLIMINSEQKVKSFLGLACVCFSFGQIIRFWLCLRSSRESINGIVVNCAKREWRTEQTFRLMAICKLISYTKLFFWLIWYFSSSSNLRDHFVYIWMMKSVMDDE